MIENKRFRKVMGFIQDNTCEGGDVEGVMDLTEIEDMLNSLNDENKELRIQYNHIREQSNEFHRIARENINRVGQLEKENKELKAEMEQSDLISKDIVCADIQHELLKVTDENKELKSKIKDLKFENEKKYRKIIQLEQMLQDVER